MRDTCVRCDISARKEKRTILANSIAAGAKVAVVTELAYRAGASFAVTYPKPEVTENEWLEECLAFVCPGVGTS